MAQGVIDKNQRFSRPKETDIPASARNTVGSLRLSRNAAWLRARRRAFGRNVIEPLRVLWAVLLTFLAPVGYHLWKLTAAVRFAALETFDAVQYGAGRCIHWCQYMVHGRAWMPRFHRAHSTFLLAGLVTVVFTYGFYGMGLEVIVDGQSLGFVRNQAQFERAVVNVTARATQLLQTPFELNPNTSYRFSLVSRSKVFDSNEVEQILFNRIEELKYLHVLEVDGQIVGGVTDSSIIENELQALKDTVHESYVSLDFLQDVKVSYQLAPSKLELSDAKMRELIHGVVRPAQYATAEEAHTVEDMAKQYGMSAATLLQLNPQLGNSDNLAGTPVLLSTAKPMLQLEVTKQESYREVVPFETQYVDDPNLYKGREKTLTAGVEGVNSIVAHVSYVGNTEISRNIVSTVATKPAVTKVVAQGSQTPPTFIRPYYGRFTSGFKTRTLFGYTRMHTGIDLAGPIGAPVVASSGGKVIFAGVKNGYGKTIVISHGQGITTLYGHNNRLLVKVGQRVKQGDQIAELGNTGRSTGPHVHFEVRVNDKPVNPMNYVK